MEEPLTTREGMVRYMLLADAAEAINGKHYILGGGFTDIRAAAGPPVVHDRISVVLKIDVPWKATTPAEHSLELDIVDADERSILSTRPGMKFEAGRPAGMRSEDSASIVMALNLLNIQFPEFGKYWLTCTIDGHEEAREHVRVVQVPIPQAG